MLGELQKSQKQVLLIAENIDQAFWIRDAQSGAYDHASSAFEKIRGRSRDLLSTNPQSGLELLHPEDRALAARAISEQFTGNPTDVQYRIVAPSGSVRWLWERTFPLRDESGLLKQIAGLTRTPPISSTPKRRCATHRATWKSAWRNARRSLQNAASW
jgi:PAS domain S-box-containing protein